MNHIDVMVEDGLHSWRFLGIDGWIEEGNKSNAWALIKSFQQ